MKTTLKFAVVLAMAVLFGITSKTTAQVITDNDLLEVASGLNVDIQHIDVGQVDVETTREVNEANEINAKVTLDKFTSSSLLKSSTTDLVADEPGEGLPEGPDIESTLESVHEFDGEETGNN